MGSHVESLEDRMKRLEEHLEMERSYFHLHYDPDEGWCAWINDDVEHDFRTETLPELVEELEREFGII